MKFASAESSAGSINEEDAEKLFYFYITKLRLVITLFKRTRDPKKHGVPFLNGEPAKLRHFEQGLPIVRPHYFEWSTPQKFCKLLVGTLGWVSWIEPHIPTRVAAEVVSVGAVLPAGELPVVVPASTACCLSFFETFRKEKTRIKEHDIGYRRLRSIYDDNLWEQEIGAHL